MVNEIKLYRTQNKIIIHTPHQPHNLLIFFYLFIFLFSLGEYTWEGIGISTAKEKKVLGSGIIAYKPNLIFLITKQWKIIMCTSLKY